MTQAPTSAKPSASAVPADPVAVVAPSMPHPDDGADGQRQGGEASHALHLAGIRRRLAGSSAAELGDEFRPDRAQHHDRQQDRRRSDPAARTIVERERDAEDAGRQQLESEARDGSPAPAIRAASRAAKQLRGRSQEDVDGRHRDRRRARMSARAPATTSTSTSNECWTYSASRRRDSRAGPPAICQNVPATSAAQQRRQRRGSPRPRQSAAWSRRQTRAARCPTPARASRSHPETAEQHGNDRGLPDDREARQRRAHRE